MKVSELMTIPCWTLLHDVPVPTEHVRDRLYRIAESLFVLAVPWDQTLNPSAPRLVQLVWAETPGAARRATLMEIEADLPVWSSNYQWGFRSPKDEDERPYAITYKLPREGEQGRNGA